MYKTDTDRLIQVSSKTDLGDTKRNIPNLGAACDICQVVHQYVILNTNSVFARIEIKTTYMALFVAPRQTVPDDILHPPTV